MKAFIVICSLLFLSTGCKETAGHNSAADTINSLELIINDMLLPNEGYPSGVPESMDWAHAPRLSYGNFPPAEWTAMTPWGQIYADSAGNPAENVRFQIRNIQAWYLSKEEGRWKLWIKSSDIDGANYAEDFQDDINIPADIRTETIGGGISATLKDGYNFHFWPAEGRVPMNADDIAGVWVSIESRLIIDDPNDPDDHDKARLMFSTGADYWQSLDAEWDQWKTNGDIGIGRFRYLSSEWQAFNMHSLTPELLKNNPPPFQE